MFQIFKTLVKAYFLYVCTVPLILWTMLLEPVQAQVSDEIHGFHVVHTDYLRAFAGYSLLSLYTLVVLSVWAWYIYKFIKHTYRGVLKELNS